MPAVTARTRLTPRQERFANEVAAGKSQADAYRVAFPGSLAWQPATVWSRASNLMAKGKVAARVEELREAISKKLRTSGAETLQEIDRIAKFDVRNIYDAQGNAIPVHLLDADTAAAIQGVEIVETVETADGKRRVVSYTRKYKVADKNAALDKLMRHFGLYATDNTQKGRALGRGIGEGLGQAIGRVEIVYVDPPKRDEQPAEPAPQKRLQ